LARQTATLDGVEISRVIKVRNVWLVGREWLGDNHPAVVCLKAGVVLHHGRLPNPFLRELEILLSDGALKVIIASPTLSQGLNLRQRLSAAVTRTFWASSIIVRAVNAWLDWLRRRLHKASRSLSDRDAIEFSLCDKA
jgi:hypothetical protein